MKKVLTVLGPVDPEDLGQTLFHEHILVDMREHWVAPETAIGGYLSEAPVTPEMLATLRRYPFSVTRDNLLLGDEEAAVRELGYYTRAGGSAVVDVTNIGLKRDPAALQRVSLATGLHIIMGGGCYVERAHPDWVKSKSLEELADLFTADVLEGAEGTRIRTGLIGEMGMSGVIKGTKVMKGHMTPEEEKVLRAGGRAAVRSGAAVSVHVDLRSQGAYQVVDRLEEEGLATDRMVICHMDFTEDLGYLRDIGGKGAYLEFSSFGREYYFDKAQKSLGNDKLRIEIIKQLIDDGFVERIVISQDVCMKMDLRKYGGPGYGHVSTTIVERMRWAGITDDEIYTILVENPRRVLAIDFDSDTLERIESDYRLVNAGRAPARAGVAV